MAGEKILVVDDDPGLLILMKTRLEAAGYQIILAEGGKEALRQAQTEAYDLAMVDLKMAGMDGMALLQELLRLYPTAAGIDPHCPRDHCQCGGGHEEGRL